jgi:hypothetical protein
MTISTPKKYEVETKTWSAFSPLPHASASPSARPPPRVPARAPHGPAPSASHFPARSRPRAIRCRLRFFFSRNPTGLPPSPLSINHPHPLTASGNPHPVGPSLSTPSSRSTPTATSPFSSASPPYIPHFNHGWTERGAKLGFEPSRCSRCCHRHLAFPIAMPPPCCDTTAGSMRLRVMSSLCRRTSPVFVDPRRCRVNTTVAQPHLRANTATESVIHMVQGCQWLMVVVPSPMYNGDDYKKRR